VFEFDRFDGALWAGTGTAHAGMAFTGSRARVSVSLPADSHRWRRRGQTWTSVVSMHVFEGRLYVGSSGWYNEESNPVSEIIRIDGAGRWQVVAGAPRTVNGQSAAPISGLSDGFNNVFTAHFWRMSTYRGELVVGTNDWAYLTVLAYPELAPWAVDADRGPC
jgi:hypothetical protein